MSLIGHMIDVWKKLEIIYKIFECQLKSAEIVDFAMKLLEFSQKSLNSEILNELLEKTWKLLW